ncbi:cathepsin O isoform X2 [Syngnathus scovelli]|uniref:cathepsin O isoform X2 n=1 Tax=Syngnathus scovelli TaxID=161590 RepID=UPI00211009CC|nr:cathepsin O isoform X2 [Syngnathus scovelli]
MNQCYLYTVAMATVVAVVAPLCCKNASSDEELKNLTGDFTPIGCCGHLMYESKGGFESYNRCFQDSTERHAYLNSFTTQPQSAKYGINHFSSLSPEEFRDLYLGSISERAPPFLGTKTKELPAKFDWRDRAVVAPVQNQQAAVWDRFLLSDSVHCGSCWAFSVVGAMQAANAIAGAPLQELSVQQVIDCCFQNGGCKGGSPAKALLWLQTTRVSLVPQSEYPYKAKNGMCHFFSSLKRGVTLRNFTSYDFSGQEEAMKAELVEKGPLSVVVDAVSWQDYLGGIIQHHCSSRWPNHAVLVVGYDATGEIPFWIVQNSWGTEWGKEGYVYVKIGSNLCGIADSVAAVLV